MKLCFVCCEYPPGPHGGTGTFTQMIARALVQAAHQVRVVGVYLPDYPAPDHEVDAGVEIWRLRQPLHPGGWLRARRSLYRLIRNWIKAAEVDLVEAPDHEGWFAGWPRLAVPLVQRAGGAYSYFAHELGQRVSPLLFQLERRSYHRADAWAAKSIYTGDITASLFGLKSPNAILYNPVDVPANRLSFDDRSKNHVVFSGTLAKKKGVVSLIDAWPSVREQNQNAELHLYGKDTRPGGASFQSYLEQRLTIEHRASVHFHGHVARESLLRIMSRAGVAVFPSMSEGFAWAPLEAMAHGCPTIYTKLGSGPELIDNGRDGLLVDPRKPEQIAAAITRLLADQQLARRLGEAGRNRVLSSFTLEKLLPLNETFYSEISKAHRALLN